MANRLESFLHTIVYTIGICLRNVSSLYVVFVSIQLCTELCLSILFYSPTVPCLQSLVTSSVLVLSWRMFFVEKLPWKASSCMVVYPL